ncbi:MAG: 4Fe-4S binding protein [Ignavibacteriaceae bacterium]|nr:4Fe-4S binding protein [Ignavibacteriaceae bacterium]
MYPIIYVIAERCIACGICYLSDVCPVYAISEGPNGVPVFNEDDCILCGACVQKCPVAAIVMNN